MYEFNAEKVTCEIIDWIKAFFEENGRGCKAVVAISGGKDSSVAAALCVAALGKERVFGVLLPNGEQADIDTSKTLVAHLEIDYTQINIKDSFDGMMRELEDKLEAEVSKQAVINLPARLRMAATYAVAQSVNGRVANTCNLSEDWVGYATRYGDGAGDFSPLSNLTVQEVKAVGIQLGLPPSLVNKVPIDGLSGLTDEDNLGFTYAVLDEYIRTGKCDDTNIKEIIDNKRRMNKFKLKLMPSFQYDAPVKAEDAD